MQQSERLLGKAVQSETRFISDFKRKVSQQNSQYTHAITQKAPWCTHQKWKKGKPQTGAIMVLITLLCWGKKTVLSLFQRHQIGVPGVYKRGFPVNPLAEIKRKKYSLHKSGTPVIEKCNCKNVEIKSASTDRAGFFDPPPPSNRPNIKGEGVNVTYKAAPQKWPITLTRGCRGQTAATPLY